MKETCRGRSIIRFGGYVSFSLFFLFLDQWTKSLIVEHFNYGQFRPVTSFFNLCYVRNTGAAFSLFSEAGEWKFLLLGGLAILLSGAILVYLWRNNDKLVHSLAYSLVMAGALGNLYDRVMTGSVVDFLDFYIGIYHWPAFNVADIAICVGAGLVILKELFTKDCHS